MQKPVQQVKCFLDTMFKSLRNKQQTIIKTLNHFFHSLLKRLENSNIFTRELCMKLVFVLTNWLLAQLSKGGRAPVDSILLQFCIDQFFLLFNNSFISDKCAKVKVQ